MKIFLFLFLINISITRKVSRIIRTHYDLPMTYKGDNFKKLVDEKYAQFEDDLEKLKEKIQSCIKRRIIIPAQAKERCLGNDFEIYEDRFNIFTFKIENVYENMIEVAFNENCLDTEENAESCYKLLDDIKILRFNDYIIIQTIRHNKDKYLTNNFTEEDLDFILDSIQYAIKKYDEYKELLNDKKIVLKGLLWNFFLEQKADMVGHELFDENDEDLNLLDEVGGEEKFFAKKLMGSIEKNFEELRSQFHDEDEEDMNYDNDEPEEKQKPQDNQNETQNNQQNDGHKEERKELQNNKIKQQPEKVFKQNYQINYILQFFSKNYRQHLKHIHKQKFFCSLKQFLLVSLLNILSKFYHVLNHMHQYNFILILLQIVYLYTYPKILMYSYKTQINLT